MRKTIVLTVAALVATLAVGRVAVAATASEGDPDISFGGTGVVTTTVGSNFSNADAAVLQPDGKLIVSGRASNGGDARFALVRYRTNGALDTTFGGDGRVLTQLGTATSVAFAVTLQSDGKIVAVGSVGRATPGADIGVVRYNPDGSLDTTFSGDGKLIRPIPGTTTTEADAVAIQPDGKIVLAARAPTATVLDQFAVVRLNPHGSLDTTFSNDGFVLTQLGSSFSLPSSLALQPDGRILVAGTGSNGSGTFMAVARYDRFGSLDGTFSGDGKQTFNIGADGGTSSLVLQPDGRIVVVGRAGNATDDFAVGRLNTNGTLDSTFGTGGKVSTPIGSGDDSAFAVALQRDGKIVVTGSASNGSNNDVALARYLPDGSLDTHFSDDGKLMQLLTASTDSGDDVVVQRDGRILVAGTGGTQFAALRYLGDLVAPFDGRMVGLSRFETALGTRLFWLASDDNTGVRSFDVRVQSGSFGSTGLGSFAPFRSTTTLPSAGFTGQAGRTYCFQVRPHDWAGNVGRFGEASCTAFPVDDRALSVAGSWANLSDARFYAGTARSSSSAGASLKLAGVHYRHLALVVTKKPGAGSVRVLLNGVLLQRVSLAAGSTHRRVLIPIDASAALRSGTVTIVQASAGKPVVIDGLAVSLA